MKRGHKLRLALLLGVPGLACVILIGLLTRPHPVTPDTATALPELHRTNLVLSAGHWHRAGETNGFTGVLLDTHDGGAKKSRTTLSNGAPHGLSLGWHTNGQAQVEEHFIAGTSHGRRTKWHPNGRKLSEITIVNGRLHGTFRRWDEHGARAEEIEMKDGQPDGLARSYFPSGFLKAEATLRGGQVIEHKSWKDGERPADG